MTEKRPMTAAERNQKTRDKRKALGLLRRDVWAHPDDWPKIRELEAELKSCRLKGSD